METPILEARDLVTHYGDKRVLDGVSCRVAQGEVFVVIGASGCGKTTLLKHLTGLLKPTSGEVLHSGEDITVLDEERLSQIQRKIGIAFQSGGLFNSMTVGENVALPLREYGGIRDKGLIEAIVRLKLSLVGLEAAQHLLPDALSGGMRKRAGLARAIALDPPLVFFDEPSAGLDPIMAAGLDDLVLRLRKLLGITFVIVTHELDSIRSIADHILMLDRGQVIFGGTLEDAERTDMARVRQFFERRADDRISQRNV
ncbi:MAG TPA: ATP-binding cassette domain-containing protein [Candidatus Hydrogenedentes bacterium]|nr:ATP-binding cassette domain-containing protein [Candidatus Hydrogenedentota bacterium]